MSITQDQFAKHLTAQALTLEEMLDAYLTPIAEAGEIERPPRLIEAIRHSALNGGKRVRPFLMLEVARLFGAPNGAGLYAAAGLECLHCYSLVHDDLPAMDDDDLRRGKPTVHIAFDEATAILAGDALLTLAFELTAHPNNKLAAPRALKLVSLLARDSGLAGMVGGQQFDLQYENQDVDQETIQTIHAMKTGALIRYACEAGAIIAGASTNDQKAMVRYGELIGLAFQLADDVLDVTADAETVGKATGKDADAGKNTLVKIHGLDWAQGRLDELVKEAEAVLAPYGDKADVLRATAHFIAKRKF